MEGIDTKFVVVNDPTMDRNQYRMEGIDTARTEMTGRDGDRNQYGMEPDEK
jgi:hypothetical protein